MGLEDRVSLISGASQGIGEAIAFTLADAGAEVVLLDIQKEKLEAVAGRIREAGGRAAAYPMDVSRLDEAVETVSAIAAAHTGSGSFV